MNAKKAKLIRKLARAASPDSPTDKYVMHTKTRMIIQGDSRTRVEKDLKKAVESGVVAIAKDSKGRRVLIDGKK